MTQLQVTVHLFQGRHETPGRAGPAQQWFDALQAPQKELVSRDSCGHRSLFERPAAFHRLMLRTVQQ